jgi:hypothetical protein
MSNEFQKNILRVAKVCDTSPKGNALDLLFLDNLGIARNAQVLSRSAGTDFGDLDMPEPTKPKDGNVFTHKETKDRDIYAVVAMIGGEPVVLGYMPPQVNQLAFDKTKHPNLKISRHASDFYQVTDNEGNTGLIHPSGTAIKIGAPPSLDGEDYDKKWKLTKNTSALKSISLQIPNKASIVLNTDGLISISSQTNNVNITASKNIVCMAQKIYLN